MLDKYAIKGIENATDFLLKEVQKRTPEDTFELQKGNKKQSITNRNWLISDWLINETPYASYVEYWVSWKAYNYYKNSWRRKWWSPFYSWVGARMYTKSQFENEKEVREIIESSINEGIRSLNRK